MSYFNALEFMRDIKSFIRDLLNFDSVKFIETLTELIDNNRLILETKISIETIK